MVWRKLQQPFDDAERQRRSTAADIRCTYLFIRHSFINNLHDHFLLTFFFCAAKVQSVLRRRGIKGVTSLSVAFRAADRSGRGLLSIDDVMAVFSSTRIDIDSKVRFRAQ